MKLTLFSNFNTIFNDAAQPWQLGFQDSAAPGFTGLVTLHNTIGFYLIVISFAVFWVLFSVMYNYSSTKNPIAYKYLTHGTVLELIWTVTPALILIAIAFPSFRLLYLMDCPIYDINSTFENLNLHLTLEAAIISNLHNNKNKTNNVEIVPYGNVCSTAQIRFNTYMRNSSIFPKDIVSQLVGHLLGDGFLYLSNTSITPLFIFTQTIKRFDYVWSVYLQLSHYCSQYPRLNTSMRKGKKHYSLQVYTRSYPKLLELYKIFYTLNNGKYVKTINLELLQYLDSKALAYWAMDDGAYTKKWILLTYKRIYLFRSLFIGRYAALFIYIKLFSSRS